MAPTKWLGVAFTYNTMHHMVRLNRIQLLAWILLGIDTVRQIMCRNELGCQRHNTMARLDGIPRDVGLLELIHVPILANHATNAGLIPGILQAD
jgi:hypothetical protein